jgi:lysozyme
MLNNTIDISHHQTVQDAASVKAAGIELVILKATEGVGYVDPAYQDNKTQLEQAGLICGSYHFGTGSDAEQQAEDYLAAAGSNGLLVLDFESNSGGTTMTLAQAETFVQYIKDKTGRFPGLYTNQNTISSVIGSSETVLANCWLWIARYGAQPDTLGPWDSWTFWQYTDGTNGDEPHGVAGIQSNGQQICDRDKFFGDTCQFNEFMVQNTGAA